MTEIKRKGAFLKLIMVLILVDWYWVLDEKECNSLQTHARNIANDILWMTVIRWLGSRGAARCSESGGAGQFISADACRVPALTNRPGARGAVSARKHSEHAQQALGV
jgi:hypothetical protein